LEQLGFVKCYHMAEVLMNPHHAQRWVAAAPMSSSANAAYIEALFMMGHRDQALVAYGDYRSRLATELGESPEPDVVALAERVRTAVNQPARRQATEEWYAAAPSFDGDLVGRAREWESMTRAWRKVGSGRSSLVVVEGDVGVGKTRLTGDYSRWVNASGGTVFRGRAFDVRGGAAFGPVIEAIRSSIDAPGIAGTDPQWLAEVARVVPELRSHFPGLSAVAAPATTDSWRLFEGIAQMLMAVAEETPVAVLIDDLHWCDADSCALLLSLIRRLESAPVLWCLTFSTGAVDRDTAAARLVRALRAFPHAVPVALRPLSEDDVWQLLRGLGRVSAPTGARRLAARIHEVTTGYPFYVMELLKTLFAQRWLTVDPETGEWIVQPQADAGLLTLAPSLHEAIGERIECLPDDLSAVLISIAVSPLGCSTNVLSHMHGISRLRAAAFGDALVERHLAIEDDRVYQCAHPVIARVVRDSLGASRRREVHRSLALALEAAAPAGAEVTDPGAIARHAEQGGERAMAYRYAMKAAEGCAARFASEEALTWLDLAAGVASGLADTDAVNRLTARLLEQSGFRETPTLQWPVVASGGFAVTDLDLPARV
jgi:predicted ATPase